MTQRSVWLAGVLLLGARSLVAQAPPDPQPLYATESFGPGEQVLHIGAAEFVPGASGYVYQGLFNDGYLYAGGTGFLWFAPLRLPAGAEIYGICLYARDSDPSAPVGLVLEVVKLAVGSIAPGIVNIASFQTSFDIGYGVQCANPFSYTYRDKGDVDGDGNLEDVVHRLRLILPGSTNAFGGVRVFWRLQVSPAPATATFNDVPTSHPFFQFIEALSKSGITAGCNAAPPLYCPDGPLTRGQMAVFLAKALGLHWPF